MAFTNLYHESRRLAFADNTTAVGDANWCIVSIHRRFKRHTIFYSFHVKEIDYNSSREQVQTKVEKGYVSSRIKTIEIKTIYQSSMSPIPP